MFFEYECGMQLGLKPKDFTFASELYIEYVWNAHYYKIHILSS
jgi:hypothetical protein